MKELKLWYLRSFKVITSNEALSLGLKHLCNIHGDLINMINCRSVWTDNKGRYYRIDELVNL